MPRIKNTNPVSKDVASKKTSTKKTKVKTEQPTELDAASTSSEKKKLPPYSRCGCAGRAKDTHSMCVACKIAGDFRLCTSKKRCVECKDIDDQG